MTRGKIIYFDEEGNAYSSVEFNGDMYPDGNAKEILEKFEAGFFESFERYENFVTRFNEKNYGYEGDLIGPEIYAEDRNISVLNNWTDYLYIINNSGKKWIIRSKDGTCYLENHSLGIVRFQELMEIRHNVKIKDVEKREFGLSKEEFVDVIDRLRDAHDLAAKVKELFANSRDNEKNDFGNGASLQISHEKVVVNLLEKLMKDSFEDIGCFIYEMDYGRKNKPGKITDKDGKELDISTAEKLYDHLVTEGNDKEIIQ